MKKLFLSIACILIYASVLPSTIISGTIKNANGKIVFLTYMGSCTVSSPNYYGGKRYSVEIKNEKFSFDIETSPDISIFTLELPDVRRNITIPIKKGDSIHIEADTKNISNTFIASGTGYSMTNYLYATNFLNNPGNSDLKPHEIIPFQQQLKEAELSLLKAFHSKSSIQLPGATSDENKELNRLKTKSLLTDNEYQLLENRTNYFMVGAINQTPFTYLIENIDTYLKLFSDINFPKDFIINDYATDDLASNYIKLSCYKKATLNGILNKKMIQKYYIENMISETASLLSGEIKQKELSDLFYDQLLTGHDQKYITNKELIDTDPYKARLEKYENNYITGLTNQEFQLNASTCNIYDTTEAKLFDSLKGKTVYLTLWDIDSSPALMPLFELSTLNLLKAKYDKDIYFLDICIANEDKKQQWASLIVNYNWRGNHYFYDTKKSDKLILL
jgi:hypothetical protein